MRILSLANTDKIALVDDEDYAILSRYPWHLNVKGYAITTIANTTMSMHRFILNPGRASQVDHINMDKLDNRKSNLRLCNNTLNQANSKKRKYRNGIKTSSEYKGVHWRKDMNKWAARISHKGKRYYLGYYDDEREAARAYNEAAYITWGEFSRLNNTIERG